jgi:hypothetical protein
MPPDRLLARLAAALFLCGLIPGIYEFRHPVDFGFGQGFEMAAIARNLVDHGAFANPFEPAVTGPTAANPPLYPLILAGLMKVFGAPGFVRAAIWINMLLNAALAALMPRISRVIYGDPWPGVFAGILWIPALRLMPEWDTTSTMAGLLVFVLITAERPRSAVVAGVLGGLLTLLNPSVALIFVPWLVWLAMTGRRTWRYAAAVTVIAAVCNLPWMARNYRVWRAPVLRTNFGYTLYSSNNDCAEASLAQNIRTGCYQATHPVASADEARLLAQMGEYEYDRMRGADARKWIYGHPDRFARLTAQRVALFWFPDPGHATRSAYAVWAITALSLPGIVLMARRRLPATVYILAVWTLYPLMYYVVVSGDRYRFPLLWTSLAPAGYFLASRWPKTVK